MVERWDGIPRFYFLLFLFRSNDKKEHLDKNDFRHGYGNYFKSAVLKVTILQSYKVTIILFQSQTKYPLNSIPLR